MADLIPLAQARCTPRRGSEHRLTDASIREWLPQVPEWALVENGHALSRTFAFKDYYRTMSFVNALAHVANAEDHHPDLSVHYDRCVVRALEMPTEAVVALLALLELRGLVQNFQGFVQSRDQIMGSVRELAGASTSLHEMAEDVGKLARS